MIYRAKSRDGRRVNSTPYNVYNRTFTPHPDELDNRYREDCKMIRMVCCFGLFVGVILKLLKLEGRFLPFMKSSAVTWILLINTVERISLLHLFFFFDFLSCLKLVFKLEIFNIVMKLVMFYRKGRSCAFVWNCLKFCFIKRIYRYMYEGIIISIIMK